MYTIERITDIDSAWDEAKPLIQKAVDESNGETAIQDVYKQLTGETHRLVVIREGGVMRAAVVLNLINYPQKMAVRFVYLGGEKMRDWIPALDDYISSWGRNNGIDCIEVVGRKGWVKMLNNYGYKPEYVHIIKQL